MSIFGLAKDHIDASHGNPLFPFQSIWRLAVTNSSHHLTQYNQNTHRSNLSPRYRAALEPIHDYFNQRGFSRAGWHGVGLDCIMMLDGGTTRAFDMVINLLARDVEDWNNDIARQNKRLNENINPIRPVILMPTPTYGHFLNNLHDNYRDKIEIVSIPRRADKNWSIDLDDLKSVVKQQIKDGKRIIAYFDSNPNNPTGYVRDKQETERIGTFLTQVSDYYLSVDASLPCAQKEQQDLFENTDNILDDILYMPPTYRRWEGITSRIQIIDDMVYDGLQYKDSPAPCSFSEALPDSKDWVTITGPSKNGLAALRAGLVIADNKLITRLREMDTHSGYCPSELTMNLLSTYFNPSAKIQKLKTNYRQQATEHYEFSAQFLKAMINGADTMKGDISKTDLRKMLATIKDTTFLSSHGATSLLNQGIEGLNISTTPQAGFFHLLDSKQLSDKGIPTEREWEYTEKKFNLTTASGVYMGMKAAQCTRRITYAMESKDLVALALRLQKITKEYSPVI